MNYHTYTFCLHPYEYRKQGSVSMLVQISIALHTFLTIGELDDHHPINFDSLMRIHLKNFKKIN